MAETNAQLEKLDAEGRAFGRWISRNMYFLPALAFRRRWSSGESVRPSSVISPCKLSFRAYRFIDGLTDDSSSAQSRRAASAAWQKLLHGKLQNRALKAMKTMTSSKVEPMNRALKKN